MPPSRSRLPPLPIKILETIEDIENFARKSLGQCAAMIPMPDRTSLMYDFPRALRVLRTCAAEFFEIQAEYYVTQPGGCEYWIELIESNVRQGLNSLALISGFPEAHKDMLDLHLQTEVLIDKVEEWKTKLRNSLKSSQEGPEQLPTKATRTIRGPNPDILKNKDTVNHREAAEALGIAGRTINRWIKDKTLTPIRVGGRNRFKTKDLLRLLKENKWDKA